MSSNGKTARQGNRPDYDLLGAQYVDGKRPKADGPGDHQPKQVSEPITRGIPPAGHGQGPNGIDFLKTRLGAWGELGKYNSTKSFLTQFSEDIALITALIIPPHNLD
jgi:hypothetical protein